MGWSCVESSRELFVRLCSFLTPSGTGILNIQFNISVYFEVRETL